LGLPAEERFSQQQFACRLTAASRIVSMVSGIRVFAIGIDCAQLAA
jgi:hypothetical protein